MDAVTSGNIQVDSLIKIKYVTALKITAGVQEHGICEVAGLLENGMEAQQILSSMEDIPICIVRNGESSELLFRGIVKEATVHAVNGVYRAEICAVTASEKLDRVKKQRSFQDTAMIYEQVVRRVLEPYGNMDIAFADDAQEAICEPLIQYGETDWQFLKRLGSHLHIPLYADCEADNKVLHFGMEKGVHIDEETETCHAGISRKYYEADRKKDSVTRKDYLYYKVRCNENGRIGDDIDTESGKHVIYKRCIELHHEQLQFTYHAGGCGNWYIPYIDHDRLTGMEFTGRVVSTQAEKMKVALQIDEPYEGADHEWEWTPVSGNIMYAMPEKGSSVRLYFGSGTASEGTAASDVRGNSGSMPGQQKRTFMTAAGKKMELHPEHLSMQGDGGQASVNDVRAVAFESNTKTELTASGTVRMEAAKIHAYTPQEINMYRSQSRCEEKGKDIIPSGTKSNPPTGTGDDGFTFNNEFNAMSSISVMCGTDFIRYKPYQDDPEETEPDEEGFSWGKLVGHCLAGLTVVGAVALGAGYLASIVFTGGATAAFAPWVVGGLAAICGTAAVGGMAANDIQRGEVSGLDDYMLTGLVSSTEGALAGAAFCMVPYASEVLVSTVVPYGMTGVCLPAGVFVSGETIMTATMATGYTVTFSNMAVKVNDSMVGLAGTNMMADVMGQGNYQQFKDVSAMGSNTILMLGLSNPRLYGTNNNNAGNIRENASYKNNNTTVEVNGKTVTMDNSTFDPNFVDKQGRTNVQRMQQGLAPIGTDGKSVNIHHIDQTNNGPVMEITATEHQQNYSSLHTNTGQEPSQINRSEFDSWRKGYWQWRSNNLD